MRALPVTVNRLLAPPAIADAFEAYIARSLTEEMDRIQDYYREHGSGFRVAIRYGLVIGMFGLETAGPGSFGLRRRYVDPTARRGGIGAFMRRFSEDTSRRRGGDRAAP